MTPSRRQFVASIATIPFLPQAAGAQGRAPARAPDAVLDQLLANLRELSAELETQPRTRKATLRAMETTLAVGAAHMAAYYDSDVRSALRRRQNRVGRAVLTQEIVLHARENGNQTVSHDTVDTAITRLEQRGVSGCFQDLQEVTRRIRLQAPEQIQAAAAARQFDYCSDLNWIITLMEAIVQVACAIAILEPTPGGEIACGALSLILGLYYLERLFFC